MNAQRKSTWRPNLTLPLAQVSPDERAEQEPFPGATIEVAVGAGEHKTTLHCSRCDLKQISLHPQPNLALLRRASLFPHNFTTLVHRSLENFQHA
jgi:hypothetical protein